MVFIYTMSLAEENITTVVIKTPKNKIKLNGLLFYWVIDVFLCEACFVAALYRAKLH